MRRIMIAVALSALGLSTAVAWERQSNRYPAIAAYHADRIKIEAAQGNSQQMQRHINAWARTTEASRFPLLGVAPKWGRFWMVSLGICGGVYAGILSWGVARYFRDRESNHFNH